MINLTKINKTRRGITLISLISIVVVLLVIAGIILRMVLGPNGLVRKAEKDEQRKSGIELRKVLIKELNNRNKIHLNENADENKVMFKSPQEIVNVFNKKAEDLNDLIFDVKFYEISEKSKKEIEKYQEEDKQNLYLEKGKEISKTNEFEEKFAKGKEAFIIEIVGASKEKEDKYRYVFQMTFKPEELISINGDLILWNKKDFEKKLEDDKNKLEKKNEDKKENK